MSTIDGKMITNEYGFNQYVDVLDEYCCPNCEMQYTNTGGGIICEQCDEDGFVALDSGPAHVRS